MLGFLRSRRIAPTALLASTLALPLSLGAQPATSPETAHELDKVRASVHDLRNVGTALWNWYNDEVLPNRSEDAKKAANKLGKNGKTVDLENIPVISTSDLRKILVPKYIQEVPERDPWGNPYEYRLNTQDPNAPQIISLRTPGQDGKFSGNAYSIGGFPDKTSGEDIAWMDGYFIRWPERR